MRAITMLRYSNLLLSALSTGVFFGTSVSLGPTTKTFRPATYVETQQATVRNLRPVMGPLLPAAVLANAAVAAVEIQRGETRRAGRDFVGVAGQLASLALTVAIELPINAQVLRWSPTSPPPGWEATRDRWAKVHALRTTTSLVGLAALLAAALSD